MGKDNREETHMRNRGLKKTKTENADNEQLPEHIIEKLKIAESKRRPDGTYPPGYHPDTIRNLRGPRWKPGETGNKTGRKKRLVADVNASLENEGYPAVTRQQIVSAYMQIIQLPITRIQDMANKNSNYPFMYKLIAKELLGKRGGEIMERMLDRAIGKPTQEIVEQNTMRVVFEYNNGLPVDDVTIPAIEEHATNAPKSNDNE